MGVTNLPEIAENLILAGRAFSTPVALIRWGTRGQQEVVSGTLATIVDRVRAAGLKPPALAVVGDVVRLREKLKWFEKLPLFGERILITRAREQAAALSQPLRALGAETIELPSIAIENPEDWSPLDSALRRLGKYDWLIFTSANGVRKFAERMGALGIDIRALGKAKLCAIGPATARELGQLHLSVDLTPEQFVAEGVVKCFSRIPLRGKRVLLPRARVARDVLPEALRKRGARVDVVEAYRTVVPGRSAERAREIFERHRPTMAVFTSSSSVNNLFQLLPADYLMPYLREMKLASIGPVTSSALRARGLEAAIEPRSYTIPALIEAIRGAVEKQRAGN